MLTLKLFLYVCSNTGGNAIAEFALRHWEKGLKRDDIELKDIETLLMKTVFNEKGMLSANQYRLHGLQTIHCYSPISCRPRTAANCVSDSDGTTAPGSTIQGATDPGAKTQMCSLKYFFQRQTLACFRNFLLFREHITYLLGTCILNR